MVTMKDIESEQFWVGFDLGGTKILAALFDDEFYQMSRKRARIRGAEGEKAGIALVIKLIRETLGETTIKSKQLGGICIGCPGPLDMENGVIIEAPNLGWRDVQIRKMIEREFDCPVSVINDVDAGVYGEYRFGAAMDARCVVGVFPGTGIGGGCVHQGEIFLGARASCMEIGHLQAVRDGQLCGCGRRGCLETVASRLAIAAQVAIAAYRGNAPYVYKSVGTDLSEIRSRTLASAIAAGDKIVEEIVSEAAEYLGIAIGDVVNLMNPDIVVLGGGMVEAMPDIFVKRAKRSAKQRAMPSFVDSFDVVAAKLGDDATIMGAAAWAQTQFSASPP